MLRFFYSSLGLAVLINNPVKKKKKSMKVIVTDLKVDPTLSPLLHESIQYSGHNLKGKCCLQALQIFCAEVKRPQTLLFVSQELELIVCNFCML